MFWRRMVIYFIPVLTRKGGHFIPKGWYRNPLKSVYWILVSYMLGLLYCLMWHVLGEGVVHLTRKRGQFYTQKLILKPTGKWLLDFVQVVYLLCQVLLYCIMWHVLGERSIYLNFDQKRGFTIGIHTNFGQISGLCQGYLTILQFVLRTPPPDRLCWKVPYWKCRLVTLFLSTCSTCLIFFSQNKALGN